MTCPCGEALLWGTQCGACDMDEIRLLRALLEVARDTAATDSLSKMASPERWRQVRKPVAEAIAEYDKWTQRGHK